MPSRDRLKEELRIILATIPMYQREMLDAVQQLQIDFTEDNLKEMIRAQSEFTARQVVIRILTDILGEE